MNGKTTWKDLLIAVLMFISVLLIVMTVIKDEPVVTSNPETIDSLLNTNDSIKVIIQIKDSIKNEEVQKVLKLDSDSTLELFKQLVRE